MLKALYDYGQRMNLTLPVGYAKKNIKAFICLSENGQFIGIRMDGEDLFLCPDIGSLANGPDKSNVLVEKYSVIFPEKPSPKSQFFREGLKDLSKQEPLAEICLQALENSECCKKIIDELEQHKVKSSDRISFMIGNAYLVERPTVQTWWQTYRQQFQKPAKADNLSLCLITGQSTEPMVTVPKNTGLSVVGGHSSGDALICFDKPAFCSYGLKKSANAPVSEEAFSQVKDALDTLLKDAPILAGTKFVHWYDKPLPKSETDPTSFLFSGMIAEDDDEDDEEEQFEPQNDANIIRQARRDADTLVKSVKSGQAVTDLPNRYYILLVSGAGGRVLVRQFHQGSYEQLKANLEQWYADLQLTNSNGTRYLKPPKLTARLIHLLKRQNTDKNTDKKIFDRLQKELSGLTVSVIYAILNGTTLPDSVAVRSLQYIRSQMCAKSSDEKNTDEKKSDKKLTVPDSIACQWLKVWLIRNHKEVHLMSEYNPNHPDPVYHIGSMVAIYAALQNAAYPDVNVTVTERFFSSALQTPALVLGRLAKMSIYHLAKLENPTLARIYENRLADVSAHIGDTIPTALTLPEQSRFALGYYQMTAALNKERLERYAAKKAANADQPDTEEE